VRDEVHTWDFGDLPDHVDLASGARAYPALQAPAVPGQPLKLVLLESPQAAAHAHEAGVRELLLARLSDRMRDLVKTARARLGLALIGSAHTPEGLALEVARRAAALSWPLAGLRTEAAFNNALQHRGDFGRTAVKLLDDVCAWLISAAELRRAIRNEQNRWPDSLMDMTQQIDSLFAPGFVSALPEPQWARVSVWLKAASTRLQRLPNKPQRDGELCAQVRPLVAQLVSSFHPARWVIEEWRVALFAQELRAQGAPTADRVKAALLESTPVSV
jgi:ATP-dependent helicase HrpA